MVPLDADFFCRAATRQTGCPGEFEPPPETAGRAAVTGANTGLFGNGGSSQITSGSRCRSDSGKPQKKQGIAAPERSRETEKKEKE
jgi:hypothetical protein